MIFLRSYFLLETTDLYYSSHRICLLKYSCFSWPFKIKRNEIIEFLTEFSYKCRLSYLPCAAQNQRLWFGFPAPFLQLQI